jgi:predicted protein tyrosine phosphatase
MPHREAPSQKICPRLTALSRFQATRYCGNAPYIVISIRSPGDPIPKLKSDPFRISRINLAIYDTTPEWEALSSNPVAAMTTDNAHRLAGFVTRHWQRCDIVVHCKFGVSRSAGVAAGILDALSLDARPYEVEPYEPNPHVRRLVRESLAKISRLEPLPPVPVVEV